MAIKQTSPLGLAGLADRMRALNSDGFRRKMAFQLGREAVHQVDVGFRQERDPYGKKWAQLRYRDGRILQDNGHLRGSVAANSHANGFRIGMTKVYAAPHQYGARVRTRKAGARVRSRARVGRIPQRQMVPMASTGGLGPIWSAAFNETASGIIDRAMRGK